MSTSGQASAGEVDGAGRDLGGLGVHIGQRVESAAAPGEILVSGTVRELVVGAGFQFEDKGEHELKGVPGRWRLYALPVFRRGRLSHGPVGAGDVVPHGRDRREVLSSRSRWPRSSGGSARRRRLARKGSPVP